MRDYQPVLDYWFGTVRNGWSVEDRMALWFFGRKEDDDFMKTEFKSLVDEAVSGGLQEWRKEKESMMAYILLLDQMTRVVHRGLPEAFSGDSLALSACKEGIEKGWDLEIPAVYGTFFYLPLEHSEDLADQEQSLLVYKNLAERFPDHKKSLDGSYDYAVQHYDIVKRFGRFPHRNKIIGRPTTAEEKAYLTSGAPSFGQ
eukprot:TRINITY_DN2684_c0_g1_i2.p1 TRINITY_DN2684_c0_g1~~TRINITY_DN2684_c0_g1_i2.p1  ORF type:complete len:211 (+),score=68.08 TRINITY_DN2684_c0_g1_i2:36-635(+)